MQEQSSPKGATHFSRRGSLSRKWGTAVSLPVARAKAEMRVRARHRLRACARGSIPRYRVEFCGWGARGEMGVFAALGLGGRRLRCDRSIFRGYVVHCDHRSAWLGGLIVCHPICICVWDGYSCAVLSCGGSGRGPANVDVSCLLLMARLFGGSAGISGRCSQLLHSGCAGISDALAFRGPGERLFGAASGFTTRSG